jgi:hypothetical protein
MIEPKLALIPSAYKANKVYSVLPSDGTGDFDFTRSGDATRINKEGLIETVGSNVPRLNYPLIDGVVSGCPSLLLEPERRNLYAYSNDVSFWDKSNVVTTSNYAISPDGTQNAFRAAFSSSTGLLYITATGTTGNNNTLSVWAKSNNGSSNKFRFFANGTTTFSNDFIATDKWQRFEFTYNCTSVTSGLTGASDSATNDIIFYGFQHEVGSYATSYIPTSGSVATRSAETCNGAGDANTFNGIEGVLMVEISALANDLTSRRINLRNSSGSNQIRIEFGTNSNLITGVLFNGANQAVINNTSNNILNSNKIAFKYKENDFALWVNGLKVGTDIVGTTIGTGILDRIDLSLSPNQTYSNIKQIQYLNTALNDSDLETLTSWTSFNEMATSQLYTIE